MSKSYFRMIVDALNTRPSGSVCIVVDSDKDFLELRSVRSEAFEVRVVKDRYGSTGRVDTIIACTKDYNVEWEFVLKDADSRIIWIKRLGP